MHSIVGCVCLWQLLPIDPDGKNSVNSQSNLHMIEPVAAAEFGILEEEKGLPAEIAQSLIDASKLYTGKCV